MISTRSSRFLTGQAMTQPLLDSKQALLRLGRLVARQRDQAWKLERFLEPRLAAVAPFIADAALETGTSLIADLFGQILLKRRDPAVARCILPLLPHESTVLASLTLAVYSVALDCPGVKKDERVLLERRFSDLLAEAGMIEVALEPAKSAAKAVEEIPDYLDINSIGLRPEFAVNPAVLEIMTDRQWISDIGWEQREKAASLSTLADRLRKVGSTSEALAAAKKAVDILRPLTNLNHGWLDASLPRALACLACCYLEAGFPVNAYEAAEEASERLMSFPAGAKLQLTAELARVRNITGVILLRLGRFADAQRATEQAVEIYRETCERDRDTFLPELARCVGNLVFIHIALGDRENAIAIGEETIELHWQLFSSNRSVFSSAFVRSLYVFSLALRYAGRDEDAASLLEASGALLLLNPQADLLETVRKSYVMMLARGVNPRENEWLRSKFDKSERRSIAMVAGQFCQDSAIRLFQDELPDEATAVCLRGIAVFEGVGDGGGASAGYGLLSSEARDDGRVHEAAGWAVRCLIAAQGAKANEGSRAINNFLHVASALGVPGIAAAWERETGAPMDETMRDDLELDIMLLRDVRDRQVPSAPVARRLAGRVESEGWKDLMAVTELELGHQRPRIPPIPSYPGHVRQLARLIVDVAETTWRTVEEIGTTDLARVAALVRTEISPASRQGVLVDFGELVDGAVAAAADEIWHGPMKRRELF